eukprot:9450745-Ditylum_brightwellii.AAC.1
MEEWLKFCQHLQAVITGQNITDPQGMYAITKSMLHKGALTAFENAEGVNRPQLELAYKKTMETYICTCSPLQAYAMQTTCVSAPLPGPPHPGPTY